MPVYPRFDRIREVGADLDEPAAHLGVPDVDVEHRHAPLLLGEGELRARPRIGGPLARGPHQLELLGAPDGHDLRVPRRRGGVQVRGHHLGLPFCGLKGDHRDAVGLRPALDVPAELLPDRLEQRRGHDRLAPVIVEEIHHSAGSLQLIHVAVQIHPVQAGDIQADMPGHHLCGRHYRGAALSRFATFHTDHPQHPIYGLRMNPRSATRGQNH